ncbi:MAG TPA: DUF2269 family protein [Jatrophihabitans sp.]|jgi:uncharacterized membrane protein|nr:DUF2269 family protein [Jatrophihabitans sp.]
MRNLLLSLHVLFAIFAIGPLVGAATTAARGVRAADGPAVTAAARMVRRYGYASIAVPVLGMGLVRPKWDAKFSYPWVWVSVLLYLVALALTLAVLAPSLAKAGHAIVDGSATRPLVARVGAAGGLIALLFAVIVFLMVFKPGGAGGS